MIQDIASELLWSAINRNSYATYQMVPFPMTLNEPLTLCSRLHHSLTLNISQTATDTTIVRPTIGGE